MRGRGGPGCEEKGLPYEGSRHLSVPQPGRMVGTGRLELPTSCVSSRRSNQLSYAPRVRSPGLAGTPSIHRLGRTEADDHAAFFAAVRVSTALSSTGSPAAGSAPKSTLGTSTATSGERPRS